MTFIVTRLYEFELLSSLKLIVLAIGAAGHQAI